MKYVIVYNTFKIAVFKSIINEMQPSFKFNFSLLVGLLFLEIGRVVRQCELV